MECLKKNYLSIEILANQKLGVLSYEMVDQKIKLGWLLLSCYESIFVACPAENPGLSPARQADPADLVFSSNALVRSFIELALAGSEKAQPPF
jgi:hypothetical protein